MTECCTLSLDLWVDLDAVIVRYRGLFTRKTLKQIKTEKVEKLYDAISGDWQNARELSVKTEMQHYQAVKLLLVAQWRHYDIETKREEWIDTKGRERKHLYYRKKTRIMVYPLFFGFQQVVPHSAINSRVHVCRDD